MGFQKRTADDVKVENNERKLLPEGFYSVAFTKAEALTTRATQGMLMLHMAPLATDGEPKSADKSHDITHMVLSDCWDDDAAFREDKTEKLAAKLGIPSSKVKQEQVQEALDKAVSMGQQGMYRAARAIVGSEELPEIPRFDKEIKKFVNKDGKVFSKDEKDDAYRATVAAGANVIADIANGDLDITGYVAYAKVVHETFNGYTNARAKALYETLPDDATLLTP